MKAALAQRTSHGAGIHSFGFATEKPLRYSAGQFIELGLQLATNDSRGAKRWFTLSSSPSEPLPTITTRIFNDSSAFKRTLDRLQIGDHVDISEPMGDFVLPMDDAIPLIYVAAGIGITPIRSMLKQLIDAHERRNVQVVYAAQSPDLLVFEEVIHASGSTYIPVISDTTPTWQGETGRLSAQRLLELTSPSDDALFFISGPEQLVESLRDWLAGFGIAKYRIIGDYFPGYSTNSLHTSP